MTDTDATPPRVVSLAPSATATLAAMGAADRLVGVTHHCEPGDDAGRAHENPSAPEPVGGWLNPDLDRVAELDPDLVCTSDGLQAEVAADCRDRGFAVHHREPATLDDAVDGFAALGAAVGLPEAGRELAARSRERLDRVAEAVSDAREATGGAGAASSETPRPVVYCEEWSDPPMAAGNWVPDAVRAAGGRYPFVDAGERSREVTPSEVESATPDHVVLHVCGHGDRVDPDTVRDRDWAIDAPVHVLDDALLNQPSPRLIDGVERLAELLSPDTGF
ncbi:cobalamin-binding protein [Halorubrum gandharaense]